jgi:hypothetical protein
MDNNEPLPKPVEEPKKRKGALITGWVLLAIGAILLLQNYFPQINGKLIAPIILIIVGIGFLLNSYYK